MLEEGSSVYMEPTKNNAYEDLQAKDIYDLCSASPTYTELTTTTSEKYSKNVRTKFIPFYGTFIKRKKIAVLIVILFFTNAISVGITCIIFSSNHPSNGETCDAVSCEGGQCVVNFDGSTACSSSNPIFNLSRSIHPEIRTSCLNGWHNFGRFCYREFRYITTWFQAMSLCRSISANLVSVHNENETYFINATFSRYPFWIGLNNLLDEHQYVWSDGSEVNYLNWNIKEPNNYNNNERCVSLIKEPFIKWNDTNCFVSFRSVLCKMSLEPDCGTDGTWFLFDNACYQFRFGSVNWQKAHIGCQNRNSYLLYISSQDENDFVVAKATKIRNPPDFWIGLYGNNTNGYQWVDGPKATYFSWSKGTFVNEGNNCVALLDNGYWYTEDCNETHGYICKKELG